MEPRDGFSKCASGVCVCVCVYAQRHTSTSFRYGGQLYARRATCWGRTIQADDSAVHVLLRRNLIARRALQLLTAVDEMETTMTHCACREEQQRISEHAQVCVLPADASAMEVLLARSCDDDVTCTVMAAQRNSRGQQGACAVVA